MSHLVLVIMVVRGVMSNFLYIVCPLKNVCSSPSPPPPIDLNGTTQNTARHIYFPQKIIDDSTNTFHFWCDNFTIFTCLKDGFLM